MMTNCFDYSSCSFVCVLCTCSYSEWLPSPGSIPARPYKWPLQNKHLSRKCLSFQETHTPLEQSIRTKGNTTELHLLGALGGGGSGLEGLLLCLGLLHLAFHDACVADQLLCSLLLLNKLNLPCGHLLFEHLALFKSLSCQVVLPLLDCQLCSLRPLVLQYPSTLGMASNNIRPLEFLGSLYLNDTHKIRTLGTLYIAQRHA